MAPASERLSRSQVSGTDGVVRLAQRAEHPLSDRAQVAAVFLESLRQPFLFAQGDVLSSRVVIIGMTNETPPL